MRRTTLLITAILLIGLLVTACQAPPVVTTGGQPAAPAAPEKIRIALVLPSTIDDLAWSQSMYEGVKKVQSELGEDRVEVAVSERLGNPADAGAAIRDYASQGFDIVIAHGAQYQATLKEMAPEFPDVSFAYGTAFETGPNIFAYDPQAQEGAYALGILAAMMTKTGKLGIVGPVEAGDAIKYNRGFIQGAKSVNPDIEVLVSYTGSFGDIVGAGELAKAEMDNGADILTGTAQQAVGAIRAVAEREGVYWISNDMDQSSLAPNHILAFQGYNWENVIKRMIEARQQGIKGGEHLVLSFANGNLILKYNPVLADQIPDEVKAAVEQALADIKAGKITIDVSQ